MFVHEPPPTERQESQKETDKMIEQKLGASNVATKSVAWVSGTVAGPIISFFKKNGFKIAVGILGFVFLLMSFLIGCYDLYLYIYHPEAYIHETLIAIFFVSGIQAVFFGLLADLVKNNK